MDAVKIGLLCITAVSIAIAVTAIACKVDKAYEICLGALAAVTVIGGWLGHSPSAGKDLGSGTIPDSNVQDLHTLLDTGLNKGKENVPAS